MASRRPLRFTILDDDDIPEPKRQRTDYCSAGPTTPPRVKESSKPCPAIQGAFEDKENLELGNTGTSFLERVSNKRLPLFRTLSTPPDSSPLTERRENVRPPRFGKSTISGPSKMSLTGGIAATVLQRRSKLLSLHPAPDVVISAPALTESDRKYRLHHEPNAAVAKKVNGEYVYVVDLAGSKCSAVVAIGEHFRIRTPRIDHDPFISSS